MVVCPHINHDVAVLLKEDGDEWRTMRYGVKVTFPIGIIFQHHQLIILQF